MLKRNKFLLIGGPCVLESRKTSLLIGKTLRDLAHSLGWDYVFKASYDKANRTSFSSPRGPGYAKGLKELAALKKILKVPVLTDVHTSEEAKAAGKVVDILQIPAFLVDKPICSLLPQRQENQLALKRVNFLPHWLFQP